MANLHQNRPDEPEPRLVGLDELPPARSTGNGRDPHLVAPEVQDPWNPAGLAVTLEEEDGVTKRAHLSVRKPDKQWWIRVHPDPAYSLAVSLLQDRAGAEFETLYLVRPEMRADLEGEFGTYQLFLAATRTGSCFFWPVKLPDPGSDTSTWTSTALAVAMEAQRGWVRIIPDKKGRGYYTKVPRNPKGFSEPTWPTESLRDLLALAFGAHVIADPSHPVAMALRGETPDLS
jgi:hypothetical protein